VIDVPNRLLQILNSFVGVFLSRSCDILHRISKAVSQFLIVNEINDFDFPGGVMRRMIYRVIVGGGFGSSTSFTVGFAQ